MHRKEDFIRELGVMALGSRLRRLSDRLNKSVTMIYRDLDFDFEPNWFTIIYRLKDKAPLSVTELAAELDLTHPGVIKIAGELTAKGLIKSMKDKNDERRRLLALTPKGKKLAEKLRPVWKNIAAVAGDMLDSADCNLLSAIDQIESCLDNTEFYDRYIDYKGSKRRKS